LGRGPGTQSKAGLSSKSGEKGGEKKYVNGGHSTKKPNNKGEGDNRTPQWQV